MFDLTLEGFIELMNKNKKLYDKLSKEKEGYYEYFETAPVFFCILWKMLTSEKTRDLHLTYLPELVLATRTESYNDDFSITLNEYLFNFDNENAERGDYDDKEIYNKAYNFYMKTLANEIMTLNEKLACILQLNKIVIDEEEQITITLDPSFIENVILKIYNNEFDDYFNKNFGKVIMKAHLKEEN